MKLRSLLLVLSLVASATLLQAQDQDSPLEGQMKILARGTRQLSMQVSDPAQQQGTITLLESLKKAVTDAKTLEPRKTATVAPADKEKFLADYRAQMDKLGDAFNQIETAVKAGHYDQAKSLLASLGPIKREGHMKFKQD